MLLLVWVEFAAEPLDFHNGQHPPPHLTSFKSFLNDLIPAIFNN
jgi:hypothetical protein